MRLILGIFCAATLAAATQADYRTQIKNKPFISILDAPYSADPTGLTDAAAAINAAIAALPSGGGNVYVPPGTYKINSATISLPSNVCLNGSDSGASILNGTGAFAVITILNATSPCVSNLGIQSVNDGILIQSSTGSVVQPSLSNVNVLTIGNGFIGVHLIGGNGSSCGSSADCIYEPQFYNVNVNGGVAAPTVGTRIGYKFEGDSSGSIAPIIIGGSVRNVKTGILGANYSNLFLSGTEFDSICTGSCNTTGTGLVFSLSGAQAQNATIDASIVTGSVDQYWNMASGSTFNTIRAAGISGLVARAVDAGTLNCVWGTTGNIGDSTVVHDYCNRPLRIIGVLIPPVATSGLPTCNAGAEGLHRSVNDSNSATFNATFAGSGSNHIDAYCNGTAWVVH